MPISPLPQSTVRLLGSAVAITTPCGLVKELIENAIDARAASIEVTVSSDSISQIVVRDDGHGIELEDFEYLGRRSHTSKLRTFDELLARGGETLGFRGEALASATSLAAVTITTRTGEDPVASRFGLKAGTGGVENLTKISAPVGTTVQVVKLFESLPVRKREALKNGNKSIAQIKDLLKTYALARPHLRLCLKVQGPARDATKRAWSYAPNKPSTVHEAVLQVFGKDLVSGCVQVSRRLEPDTLVPLHLKLPPPITIHAFLPAPDCDGKLVKGKGAHISVDYRPISSSRGFAKKLLKMYRSHLAGAMSRKGSSVSPVNPFIQLNICCPPCSYDPNVTPLKDEVIFSDEARILECFESMCREVYSKAKASEGGSNKDPSHEVASISITPPTIERLNSAAARKTEAQAQPEGEACLDVPQAKARTELLHEAQMRIKPRVNMARTGSNTSAGTDVDQTVPIRLPPLSPVREDSISKEKRKLSPPGLGQPAAKYVVESIEHYFPPSSNHDIHIATDETATIEIEDEIGTAAEEEQHWGEMLRDSRRHPRRQALLPLQDLGENELNELSGPEPQELRSPDARFGVMRLLQTANRMIDNRPPMPPMRTRIQLHGTPPDSSPPSRGPPISSDVASPQIVTSFHGIRTPPSSDLRGSGRNPNPAFRPQRPSDALRRRSRVDTGGFSPMIRPVGRAGMGISLGRTSDRNGLRDTSLPVDMHRLGSSEDLPYEVRGDLLDDAPPSVYRGGQRPRPRPHARRGGFLNVSSVSSRTQTRGLGLDHHSQMGRSGGQMAWPGQRVLPSIEEGSPPLPPPMRYLDAGGLAPTGRPAPYELEHEALRRRSRDSPYSPAHEAGSIVDPGHHPNKRRRLHRSLSRRSSAGPPLETTRHELRMQAVSVEVRPGLDEISRWGQMLSPWEPYIDSGQMEAGLPFRTMDEVGRAEAKLREVVDGWMKRTGGEATVVYTMHSRAKGKKAA